MRVPLLWTSSQPQNRTVSTHSPHRRECVGPVVFVWLLRAPEKRYTQVRDARHHAAPSKRIRLRVESGRASLPEAFGCIARQGPMLRIDSHRRTVNLTTRPTRCAWMRLDAPTGPGGARAVRFVAPCGQGEAFTSYATASGRWRCNTSSLGCRRARSEQSRPTCTCNKPNRGTDRERESHRAETGERSAPRTTL